MIKDFASFATCQFSTLKRISGCLEDVVSHKTLDIKSMCVLRVVSIILAEISAHHFQLKCIGGHFFRCHPYIESTTVLSDNRSILFIQKQY